jgi:hypothetical protein
MTHYRLSSTELVHTPGLVRYARHLYNGPKGPGHRKNRQAALSLMKCYQLPEEIVKKMLDDRYQIVIDDKKGTVVFTM